MEFTDSILFTTTCEGKISNISYKKESRLIMNILLSIDVNIESYNVTSKELGDTQMDIINFKCDNGFIKIPNISDKSNEDYANEFEKLFISSKKNKLVDSDILCIGCNYGEYMSRDYIKITTPIKKSNRGRKKKSKKKSTRKRIGNGNYFNSQITLTLKDPIMLDVIEKYSKEENIVDNVIFTKLKSCMYHIKIYTNGKFQVPFVRDEDINTVVPTVKKAIDIVSIYENVKEDETSICELEYIKSIMKNYRFNIVKDTTLIDIKKLRKIVSLFKSYSENNKSLDEYEELLTNSMLYNKMSKEDYDNILLEFNSNYNILSKRKITLVKYNNDNYTGFVIKFLTPSEDNANKETTVAIFDSNKINLYGCSSREESIVLKQVLFSILSINNNCCLYEK